VQGVRVVFCPMPLIFECFGAQGAVLATKPLERRLRIQKGAGRSHENARTEPGVFKSQEDGFCGQAMVLPKATAVSAMRLEKPHSLSYQDITRQKVPSITLVWSMWKIEERESWLKSDDTFLSSV
jgi:hypothetical protein